jgi:hypothetical protein
MKSVAEVRRKHVVAPRDGCGLVGELVGVEGVLAGERLPDERRHEEDAEADREAVVVDEPPQSTTSPMPIQRARPPTIRKQ